MTTARQSDYISESREAVKQLWNALDTLVGMQREWNALDYGNTLADGIGANTGIIKTDVGACVFDSANAFVTVMNTGVATNLAKLL